jgi:translocation protein SEC62
MQRQLAIDAEKAGMTVPEFIEHIKRQAQEQMRMRAQQQAQQGGHTHGPDCNHDHDHDHDHGHSHPQQGRPQPITPGPPNPKAIALAKFLRGQELKLRTVILNGERKDMFRGRLARRMKLFTY